MVGCRRTRRERKNEDSVARAGVLREHCGDANEPEGRKAEKKRKPNNYVSWKVVTSSKSG